MTVAALLGASAFAAEAPLAFWAAAIATGVALALALGRGPLRWACFTAVISAASVIAAPAWGWLLDLALAGGLLLAARAWPRVSGFAKRAVVRLRTPSTRQGATVRLDDNLRHARLLGRTARVISIASAAAEVRLRLDGVGWRARVEGPALAAEALVRVVRIDADGRLVVRAAA